MAKQYSHLRCPRCGSLKTVPVYYGDEEPVDFDLKPFHKRKKPESDPAALFGADPQWHCRDCGYSFDRSRNFEVSDIKYLRFVTGGYWSGYVSFYLWSEDGYCFHCFDQSELRDKIEEYSRAADQLYEGKISGDGWQRGAGGGTFGSTDLELPPSPVIGLMEELDKSQYVKEMNSLLSCGILDWKRDLRERILDGPEWYLDIRIEPENKTVKPRTIHILGNIRYPWQWRKFISVLEEITGRGKADFFYYEEDEEDKEKDED